MKKRCPVFITSFLIVFLCSHFLQGATYTWVGISSTWTTGNNWSPTAPTGGPTTNDNVIITSVISPKVAPIISSDITVANFIMTSGKLTIYSVRTLTITGTFLVTGGTTEIAGSGILTIGSSSALTASSTIGDNTPGLQISPTLNINSTIVRLKQSSLNYVNIRGSDLIITSCTFNGFFTLKKEGTPSASINGVNIFNNTSSFISSGTGSLLFGTAGTDFFSFQKNVTFDKQSTGIIEPARYGSTEFYGNVVYNTSAAGETNTFGNVGGGSCNFKGNVKQFIGSTGAGLNFNALTIDKTSNDVILNTPLNLVAVSGTNPQLNLLNGNLVTSYNTTPPRLITIPDNTTVVLNPDPTKSFIAGPARKTGIASFTFPLGKGLFYKPFSIGAALPATSNSFVAEYYDVAPPSNSNLNADVGTVSACEYWKLTKEQGTSDVKVTLGWSLLNCEEVQATSLKFCRYNGTIFKWESVSASISATNKTIASTSELSTYGNFTLGYSTKRIYLDTRGLDPVAFTVTGAQLSSITYTSGLSGPTNDGLIPLLPIPPATGTSVITVGMLAGDNNEAAKMNFSIDNASMISNVTASMNNGTVFNPMVSDFYTIDNTPSNGKTLKLLRGDESLPLFTTNLIDGMVFNNIVGNTFSIAGVAGYTINSFKITTLDNVLIKGPMTLAVWDGTNLSNAEVSPGVYKFELILTNNGTNYTYQGEVIVK